MTEVLEAAKSQVQVARERAAAVRASRTPEQLAAIERRVREFNWRLVHMFCGPELETYKGHMPSMIASHEAFLAWRVEHPATHIWAEWERKVIEDHERDA